MCRTGLTGLDTLLLLAPHDPSGFAEGFPAVPSDAALKCLTNLSRLQLQASWRRCSIVMAASSNCGIHMCLHAHPQPKKKRNRLAYEQVAGVEPANGSIQPGITRLRRLARLHIVGTLEGNVVELPPGFGTLSALTFLNFSLVV